MDMNEKLTEYFSINGRLNRKPYFLRNIGVIISGLIFAVFWGMTMVISDTLALMFSFLFIVFWLSCAIFLLIQSIKRLHDLNKSGWYLLIRLASIIPLIGWIIVLVFDLYLFLAKGTEGPNQYGPDPLDEQPYNGGVVFGAFYEKPEPVYEEGNYENRYEDDYYEDDYYDYDEDVKK
ncbi:MAG: DUF805 domain-containing protein [Methanimicrococcus sp.]|nr:DUF805 domain-containing protein [Methanimicrococcus sp.]